MFRSPREGESKRTPRIALGEAKAPIQGMRSHSPAKSDPPFVVNPLVLEQITDFDVEANFAKESDTDGRIH